MTHNSCLEIKLTSHIHIHLGSPQTKDRPASRTTTHPPITTRCSQSQGRETPHYWAVQWIISLSPLTCFKHIHSGMWVGWQLRDSKRIRVISQHLLLLIEAGFMPYRPSLAILEPRIELYLQIATPISEIVHLKSALRLITLPISTCWDTTTKNTPTLKSKPFLVCPPSLAESSWSFRM
jgi:hypothetical protein